MSLCTISLFRFLKESISVLYWVGMWSLIMPSQETKLTLAWMCLGVGILGIVITNTIDEYIQQKRYLNILQTAYNQNSQLSSNISCKERTVI